MDWTTGSIYLFLCDDFAVAVNSSHSAKPTHWSASFTTGGWLVTYTLVLNPLTKVHFSQELIPRQINYCPTSLAKVWPDLDARFVLHSFMLSTWVRNHWWTNRILHLFYFTVGLAAYGLGFSSSFLKVLSQHSHLPDLYWQQWCSHSSQYHCGPLMKSRCLCVPLAGENLPIRAGCSDPHRSGRSSLQLYPCIFALSATKIHKLSSKLHCLCRV